MAGTGYIRRILYFTEFKENNQRENAGFGRVEQRGDWLNYTFSLKVPCVKGNW